MPSCVYVIELAPAAGRRRDPRIPWLYVGSTGRKIATRYDQHRRGYKSAGIVKRHGMRLRPDLYEDLPAFPGSRTAQKAEVERAVELSTAGFVAHCDGVSYGKGSGDWREWGAERLGPVAGHLDAAITELAKCTFEPASPAQIAHLLHGAHAFWVPRLIDQADPPPSYGQFSHVAIDVLVERAGRAAPLPSTR